jgi:hypothetical protein
MTKTASAFALPKPQPVTKPEPLTVQVVTRVGPPSRDRIKALAEAEGITVQQLGVYAWSLALAAYGLDPLPEGGA